MAIIKQFDKRSGITYAYESHSYWDKEKKTCRAKRKLIGRVDPITGEINPTDGRCKRDKVKNIKAQNPDYKKLYEGLQKKYIAMETLHVALQREIKELKEKARYV